MKNKPISQINPSHSYGSSSGRLGSMNEQKWDIDKKYSLNNDIKDIVIKDDKKCHLIYIAMISDKIMSMNSHATRVTVPLVSVKEKQH